MQELTQNLWERYGFFANPFDTRALSLSQGAWFSVNNAYVSRKNGSEAASVITNFFRNPGIRLGGNYPLSFQYGRFHGHSVRGFHCPIQWEKNGGFLGLS